MRKTLNKTTGKAKRLIMAAALFILSVSQAWAYDFSAVSSSGHTLYYEIISGTTNVGVVRPGSGSSYDNYVSGNVVIPATVSYNGTTYNVTELKSILGADGYDYGSFDYCRGLTSVNIPNSVTSIGNYAFYYCTGLTSATIPNSVTSIGVGAFYGCTSLTSVTIPNSVTSIGDGAFNSVRHIIYSGTAIGSPWEARFINGYIEGDFVYTDSTKTILTTYIGIDSNVAIPNSVTSIGECAFLHCNNLTSVTIPNSVITIGAFAFQNCGLTSVIIPNSVTTIDAYAFSICKALTSVTLPNSITIIDTGIFWSCVNLIAITIPNNVTSIRPSAFSSCSSLTSVTIPDNITSIGRSAFNGCSSLTSVTIPNNVTSMGNSAFRGCSSLATLNFNAINCSDFNYETYDHPFYHCPVPTITIGDSVQRIPAYFAYHLDSLRNIVIGNSVTSIGSFAFNGCASLDTIIIPNNITTLGESTFENCTNLAYAVIGKNMSYIESKAFYGCNNMHNVKSLASFPPTLGSNIFSATAILKVPCGSAAYYSAPAAKWGEYFISIEEICDNITITVISANENMGTVSGSGEYLFGSEVTITATPKQGYRFVSWYDGNTENPRTIVVEAEATYIATFEEEIGIETASELDELRLYPNPTSGTITFNSTDIRKVEVMDAMGRMVAVYNDSYIIDLSKLSKGYYTLRITTDRGVAIRKVVRN